MDLSTLVYSPLHEEQDQFAGWSKSTIDYVWANQSKIYTSIRGIAKSSNKILQKTDVEDVFQEVLKYLYTCDDYNVVKAYERSSTSMIVSLEGYVHSCIKCCVLRYVSNKCKEEKRLVRDVVQDEDGRELSLFDTIPDINTNTDNIVLNMGCDLREICKAYEHQRYSFGPDIFQLWFIRLQTMILGKKDKYKDILEVLGVSKKDVASIEKKTVEDGAMLSIAKAITLLGVEEAVEVLRDFTYSADKIEKVIQFI